MNLPNSRIPGVDDRRRLPLHGGMSRPLCLFALSLIAVSVCTTGCRTSTAYSRMYSPRSTRYVPPPPKTEKSAEELLKATDPGTVIDPSAPPSMDFPPVDPSAPPDFPPTPPAADPLAPPAMDPLAPPPAL